MNATGHPPSRVLLVDDNQFVTRALAALLRDEGYEPVVFYSGAPAIEYCRTNCPDAALIDIHLPDISGLDLSLHIRSRLGQELPIIIFSGDTSMEMLRSLPQFGATYFLSKPVSATLLINSLRLWTGGPKV
jgi:CheY-like chemotaxis protein